MKPSDSCTVQVLTGCDWLTEGIYAINGCELARLIKISLGNAEGKSSVYDIYECYNLIANTIDSNFSSVGGWV